MATSLIVLSPSVGAVAPYERWDQGTPPAVSAANTARVYFDSVSKTLKLSNNGGAYFDIATGSASPWNNTAQPGYITENITTEDVLIGTTNIPGAPRKLSILSGVNPKGIRVEDAASNTNVLDFLKTGDTTTTLQVTGTTISFGPGAALALDTTLSRIAGPLLDVNVGTQFGGTIQRFESTWTIQTLRTTNDGGGDDITLKGADALAAAPGAYTGGRVYIRAGTSSANGGLATASGAEVTITAADGVTGGALPAVGGFINLVTGIGAGLGGASGDIVCGDSGGNGTNILPATDQTGAVGKQGKIGSNSERWDGFYSSDDRRGGFIVQPTFPIANPLATLSGISHPRSVVGLAMGPGSTAVDLRMQRDVLAGGGTAKFAFYSDTTMTGAASLIPGIDSDNGGKIGSVSDPTDIRRWNSVFVSNEYSVYNGLICPSFPQAAYGQNIQFSDGNNPADVTVARSTLSTLAPYLQSNVSILPANDSTGDIGICTATDSYRWNSVVANNHEVYISSGDSEPQVRINGLAGVNNGGRIFLGLGGATAPDIRIRRGAITDGLPTIRCDDNAGGGVNIFPGADNVGQIGNANVRWQLVRAVTITSGDMCFDDQTCQVCGQQFEEGDDLVLRVIRIEPDGNTGRRLTRTVPAHHGCK